jgi:hypothetical protein
MSASGLRRTVHSKVPLMFTWASELNLSNLKARYDFDNERFRDKDLYVFPLLGRVSELSSILVQERHHSPCYLHK